MRQLLGVLAGYARRLAPSWLVVAVAFGVWRGFAEDDVGEGVIGALLFVCLGPMLLPVLYIREEQPNAGWQLWAFALAWTSAAILVVILMGDVLRRL